nr:hypothetical protein [Tanacetum cinerariifolium]
MERFKILMSHLNIRDTELNYGFKLAFKRYFGELHDTFYQKMFQNVYQLQWKLRKRNVHVCDPKTCLAVLQTQFKEFFDSKEVVDERVIQYGELQMKEREVKAIKEIEKWLNGSKMQTQESLVIEGATLEASLVTEGVALEESLVTKDVKKTLVDTVSSDIEYVDIIPSYDSDTVFEVKERQEKDKIESKPNKNGKRGEARQSQKKFNRISFFETPKVLLLAGDRVLEIKDALGNKQYKPEDIKELFRKLLDDLQNIHEELAENINTPGWNRPAFYDDDDDDDEPDNSLSMGDEHLDTIPATESDEVIKSSIEDLVPIPSESEGILDTMCDVHLVNNPTPLEAKYHFEIVINSNDDYSFSDDDSLYNEKIKYVEASPHDSELVSLKVEKIVISEDEEIEDDNLREKLLKVNILIAKIEALKDNPTPSFEFLTKSSSTSPRSFLEETNTVDNSLPEFENFCFDLEEISSSSTTTHSDISLSDYEDFSFYDDHIKEISSGSTNTHYDISLSEYDSFIFDLSNNQFPPTDRSDFTHEEFADELAHIISPPEYDCFYFRDLPDPGYASVCSVLVFVYGNPFICLVYFVVISCPVFPEI